METICMLKRLAAELKPGPTVLRLSIFLLSFTFTNNSHAFLSSARTSAARMKDCYGRNTPIENVAFLGKTIDWVDLEKGEFPEVGLLYRQDPKTNSLLPNSTATALGAGCNIVISTAHQKYASQKAVERGYRLGQDMGKLSFLGDDDSSHYQKVPESREIYRGTNFVGDPWNGTHDLRVSKLGSSGVPGSDCSQSFMIASKEKINSIRSDPKPFSVTVIGFQAVCKDDAEKPKPDGACSSGKVAKKKMEDCSAHNPLLPTSYDLGSNRLMLTCDSARDGFSGSIVTVYDADLKRGLIIGIVNGVVYPKKSGEVDYSEFSSSEIAPNFMNASVITPELIDAIKKLDPKIVQSGSVSY